jgi:exosortase/archaeosortase family protein
MIVDQWLVNPYQMTETWIAPSLAKVTAGILGLFSEDIWVHGSVLGIAMTPGIHIVKGCVGLNYYAMFGGFVWAFPARGSWMREFSFIVFGMGLIYLINILRMVMLALVQLWVPVYFDSLHYWTGSYLFFTIILGLWMIYVQDLPVDEQSENR